VAEVSRGLLGGSFNPPHLGHVALAREAVSHFGLDGLDVVVAANPGHKEVAVPGETRLELARAAFPEYAVVLDDHSRTIDMLRDGDRRDPLFLVGADEFCDFPTWKEPDAVLELAHLGVATRPGYPRARLDAVLRGLRRPERVAFFEIEPLDISSSDIRRRVAAGEPIGALVPAEVAALIEAHGLYRGYTARESAERR
jgi:nicotinate-nucleotide adenylyltransferase